MILPPPPATTPLLTHPPEVVAEAEAEIERIQEGEGADTDPTVQVGVGAEEGVEETKGVGVIDLDKGVWVEEENDG